MCHFWPSQLPLADDQYKTFGSRQKKENKELKGNASKANYAVLSSSKKKPILSREDAQDSVVFCLEELRRP